MLSMSIFGSRQPNEWDHQTQQKAKPDWTHFLAPDAASVLRTVLESAYKHRQAYFKAEDIKNAQLWSAITELKREMDEINRKLDRLSPQEKESFRVGLSDGSAAMATIKSALKPAVEDSWEAKDALIESLMKF